MSRTKHNSPRRDGGYQQMKKFARTRFRARTKTLCQKILRGVDVSCSDFPHKNAYFDGWWIS